MQTATVKFRVSGYIWDESYNVIAELYFERCLQRSGGGTSHMYLAVGGGVSRTVPLGRSLESVVYVLVGGVSRTLRLGAESRERRARACRAPAPAAV